MPDDVTLHIDTLILDGFSPADGWRAADAIEAELRRLIIEQGWPQGMREDARYDVLPAGALRLAPSAAGNGRAIAGRLWSALSMPAGAAPDSTRSTGAALPAGAATGPARGADPR